MKNLITSFALLTAISAFAQTTSNFETLSLAPASAWTATSGSEQGFSDGNVYFPSTWDTSFGGFWAGGFAYSNQTDSTTSGYLNPFSAKIASGYAGSSTYAVNNGNNHFKLIGSASGKQLNGSFLTNTTYAYNSMRDGDAFSKKFGGANGDDPDYFRVRFFGHIQGVASGDTVTVYLADFRNPDNSQDYILKNWTWVDFSSLGNVDSVAWSFESTDLGMFGINTPKYFCMDNLVTADSPAGLTAINSTREAMLYPNPASEHVCIKSSYASKTIEIIDYNGRVVRSIQPNSEVSIVQINDLASGVYIVRNHTNKGIFAEKLIVVQP
jgi:hypothetical protein